MKKLICAMKNLFGKTAAFAKSVLTNLFGKAAASAKTVLTKTTAEGYVDSGVKIIIAVVVGGLLLAGLYTLFDSTIIPTMTEEIGDMFSYTGN